MSTLRRALTSAFFLSGLLILSSAFAPPYRSAARGAPKCASTARPAQPDRPPVVLFPFPAWPPAQASRVLSGFDEGRTLDLPSAPATASAQGYALWPRGYEPRPVHGLLASQMLGQPAWPQNEAPAELPITPPAVTAPHSASHSALHTRGAPPNA